MSEKSKHNDSLDEFSKQLQSKLKEHKIPVDSQVWSGIEAHLTNQPKLSKKPLIIPWIWISSAVAAAIAAILYLSIPSSESDLQKQILFNEIAQTKSEIIEKEVENNTSNVNYALKETSNKTDYQKRKEKKAGSAIILSENTIENIKNSANSEEKETRIIDSKSEKEGRKEQETKKIEQLPDLNDYPEPIENERIKEKKQPVLLALAMKGNVSNTSNSNNANGNLPMRAMVNKEIVENNYNILNAGDFSNAYYHIPFTFSLKLTQPLNSYFSIESGLSYTYLRTDFSYNGSQNRNGKLELHYLGVPLNLRANIINTTYFNFYALGGGTIEKGVHSLYKQKIDNQYHSINTTVNSMVDGYQISLQGAIGVDYKINSRISLFVEPQIAHYFDNDQPMSIRTSKPSTFSINGGLRIELK